MFRLLTYKYTQRMIFSPFSQDGVDVPVEKGYQETGGDGVTVDMQNVYRFTHINFYGEVGTSGKIQVSCREGRSGQGSRFQ